MTTITLHGTTYGIEGNYYDGDLLLISSSQDVNIEGGYDELKADAIMEHGYVDKISGEVECEQHDIDAYIEAHIEHYILKNFSRGKVTVNS